MRLATKMGGALLAMTAVFVCLGAAPASADTSTALCKVNTEACKKADVAGEAFTATSEATFNFGELGTFKCSSTMLRNETGVTGQISSLSFTGCSEGCEVKASNLPYGASLVNPISGSGKINISSGGSGEPTLGVLCGGLECVYSASVVESEFKGGNPATVVVSKSMTKKTGSFLCPKTPKWEASYKLTSPASAVYMLKRAFEGPVFCKVNEKVCPQNKIERNVETELKGGTFKITKLVGGNLSCGGGEMYILRGSTAFEPGPSDYQEYLYSCTHPTYTACSVVHETVDYGYLLPFTGGNGEIAVKMGKAGKTPTLRIKCSSGGTPFECKYSTEEFGLEFTPGAAPSFQVIGSMSRLEGSATFCPGSVVIQATYNAFSTLYMTEA